MRQIGWCLSVLLLFRREPPSGINAGFAKRDKTWVHAKRDKTWVYAKRDKCWIRVKRDKCWVRQAG